MLDSETRQQLCDYFALATSYRDFENKEKIVNPVNLERLLSALGVPTASPEQTKVYLAHLKREDAERILAPVYLLKAAGPHHIQVQLPPRFLNQGLAWRLTEEKGRTHSGNWRPGSTLIEGVEDVDGSGARKRVRTALTLSDSLEQGYHKFELFDENGEVLAATELIVVPNRCHQPEFLEQKKCWGASVQLYTIRSKRNWGIGDFTDLLTLIRHASALGMDGIGLNPLHALFPCDPELYCPYSASNRLFLNFMYIDVEAVPEFETCQSARAKVADRHFQSELSNLRAANLVDYSGVVKAKLTVLEELHSDFYALLQHENGARIQDYREFLDHGGELLRRHALYDALHAHFRAMGSEYRGWDSWPAAFQDPDSTAVKQFALAYIERVDFYLYLQFLAAEQLERARAYASQMGMRLGLYGDIAIGVNAQGSEIWSAKALYAFEATVGVPPDALGPLGQNWDLPPISPRVMRANHYQVFRDLLRGNMHYYGALRIDHILGFLRLFWIPKGQAAQDGAYVYYPLEDFFGIIALESQRNQCLVIGEDLGTVPSEFRSSMEKFGIFSYNVLFFEREKDGNFSAPLSYPSQSLATISTHDLPTLLGYWSSEDIQLRDRLRLYSGSEARDGQLKARAEDRERLLHALEGQGLLPDDLPAKAQLNAKEQKRLIEAVHAYMARCGARVLMIQLEDWLGMLEGVNLPGTGLEYPNWRRKLSEDLEQLFTEPKLHRLAQLVCENRKYQPEPHKTLWQRILAWLGW